eukprot:CAMPEP_0204020700 /NCGR_PEP_ID=MMETSP0360-20130528/29603_1 /ASSEMBLY_ACC=CAM_ASM_000342 /TAXON_ID=268821 /ORGANISM="Scrippsiella Hangoei, Strain SHTV-5" /LENGTH=51 /DNA_ID=CAMNT_0050964037 /DNA_START=26 /DNA_END=177 /DNA_ORIENTATION=+
MSCNSSSVMTSSGGDTFISELPNKKPVFSKASLDSGMRKMSRRCVTIPALT